MKRYDCDDLPAAIHSALQQIFWTDDNLLLPNYHYYQTSEPKPMIDDQITTTKMVACIYNIYKLVLTRRKNNCISSTKHPQRITDCIFFKTRAF